MNVEDEIEALLSEAKDAAEIENRNQERSPSPTYALEMPPEKGDQETLHAKGLWPSIGSKKAKKGQDEVQKLLADVAKAKSELSRAYEDNKDAHHKKSKKNKRMSEKTHAGVDRGDDASDSSDEGVVTF
ncbi:hypothetical protein SARC_06708 [Sphaeroforma arctica JP610]|uniref:Uncharacterized protein n=1 Tax=Sphaeroforma arctica JP610 TaxID=667725 RepID=A0A0L0FYA1_9EUKA|nr:hypothetical protein SARC_06708 [Sphaeroforma arctica JP610]KNC80943.1 hypothetical protein SARC_06708 [Sphaeroforma arctica JP610]|eukprot:XP_014154845.1 hypothetical protein SARC_06708 [Sphaeroforma arctica JP610]